MVFLFVVFLSSLFCCKTHQRVLSQLEMKEREKKKGLHHLVLPSFVGITARQINDTISNLKAMAGSDSQGGEGPKSESLTAFAKNEATGVSFREVSSSHGLSKVSICYTYKLDNLKLHN